MLKWFKIMANEKRFHVLPSFTTAMPWRLAKQRTPLGVNSWGCWGQYGGQRLPNTLASSDPG